jgi:hypothetical protein
MKRTLFYVAGTLILIFAVDTGFALEQEPNIFRRGSAESVNRPGRREPNQQAQQRREQLRQQARERILEQAKLRHMESNQPGDMNMPRRVRDANMPLVRPNIQPQQQLPLIEQQIAAEEAKHVERLARLKRIQELAKQKNDTQTLERVNNLIEQETRLFDAKAVRLKHRKDRVLELTQKGAADMNKMPVTADANKDGNKPPVPGPVKTNKL